MQPLSAEKLNRKETAFETPQSKLSTLNKVLTKEQLNVSPQSGQKTVFKFVETAESDDFQSPQQMTGEDPEDRHLSQRAHFFKGQLKFMDDEPEKIDEDPLDLVEDEYTASLKDMYKNSNRFTME